MTTQDRIRAAGVEPVKHWCETCEGLGYYDATLGSDSQLANSKQKCPDCDGRGYWLASAPDAAPPAIQKVSLTDEQRCSITAMWSSKNRNYTVSDIIDAVEAAHGITPATGTQVAP